MEGEARPFGRCEEKADMTREEYETAYGAVELRFSSYYKYTFTFTGTAPDGAHISADYGGNADDIYRHSVSYNQTQPASLGEGWYSVTVTKDGETLFKHYDY